MYTCIKIQNTHVQYIQSVIYLFRLFIRGENELYETYKNTKCTNINKNKIFKITMCYYFVVLRNLAGNILLRLLAVHRGCWHYVMYS